MLGIIKGFINTISDPKILFNLVILAFLLVFPPTKFLERIHLKLRLNQLWTNKGGLVLAGVFLFIFLFGMSDANFRLILTKPDNVPIILLLASVTFFLWLSMKQATANDARMEQGLKPNEAEDSKEKVLVWPDLVYIEFIALVAVSALLLFWAAALPAPLEEPANPTVSPNPSKAPWYFLGLQEMLVYFDPWIAGVIFPTVILVGFMCIPYLDNNPKGSGYYTFKERKLALSIFLFLFLVLWVFLISVGTFLRGPNWNFFGPFEYWDAHKLAALNNINLSELVYMVGLKRGMPDNILLRELPGFIVLGLYFGAIPLIMMKTLCRKVYDRIGLLRYSIFIMLVLLAVSLPIKMYLRWAFNIKYIVAIPEFFLNI